MMSQSMWLSIVILALVPDLTHTNDKHYKYHEYIKVCVGQSNYDNRKIEGILYREENQHPVGNEDYLAKLGFYFLQDNKLKPSSELCRKFQNDFYQISSSLKERRNFDPVLHSRICDKFVDLVTKCIEPMPVRESIFYQKVPAITYTGRESNIKEQIMQQCYVNSYSSATAIQQVLLQETVVEYPAEPEEYLHILGFYYLHENKLSSVNPNVCNEYIPVFDRISAYLRARTNLNNELHFKICDKLTYLRLKCNPPTVRGTSTAPASGSGGQWNQAMVSAPTHANDEHFKYHEYMQVCVGASIYDAKKNKGILSQEEMQQPVGNEEYLAKLGFYFLHNHMLKPSSDLCGSFVKTDDFFKGNFYQISLSLKALYFDNILRSKICDKFVGLATKCIEPLPENDVKTKASTRKGGER